MRKFLLFLTVLLLAAGCHKAPATVLAPPATQYAGKLDKVEQIIYEKTQKIDAKYTIADGQDALSFLKSIRTVGVKNYPGIGDMVTSIDGITADSQHFWAFYVNGKSSNVGARSYKIKDGDILEWKLEVISSGGN